MRHSTGFLLVATLLAAGCSSSGPRTPESVKRFEQGDYAGAYELQVARIQAPEPEWDDRDAPLEYMRADAARLAIAAARAVAGAAMERYGADTIEACVKDALADLRAEPRIAVRVAPHLADPLAERLYQYAEAEGFDGAVVVRSAFGLRELWRDIQSLDNQVPAACSLVLDRRSVPPETAAKAKRLPSGLHAPAEFRNWRLW